MVEQAGTAREAQPDAASNGTCDEQAIACLAVLKKNLVAAYCDGDLDFEEAEAMAARMRQRYPLDWGAA
jgi:hypothetical protein